MQKSTKVFRVVAISNNPNSFGLHGHIMVAKDGEAWEVARSRAGDFHLWNKGQEVVVPFNGKVAQWCLLLVELPRRLPNAPKKVVAEIFSKPCKPTGDANATA